MISLKLAYLKCALHYYYLSMHYRVVVHRGVVVDLLGVPFHVDVTLGYAFGNEGALDNGLNVLVRIEDESRHVDAQLVREGQVELLHFDLQLFRLAFGVHANLPKANLH